MGKSSIIIGSAGQAVAANIARRRAELGMTQQRLSELSRSAGRPLTRQAVAEIETGKRRVDVDDLVILAGCLELCHQDLMDPPAPASAGSAGTSNRAIAGEQV